MLGYNIYSLITALTIVCMVCPQTVLTTVYMVWSQTVLTTVSMVWSQTVLTTVSMVWPQTVFTTVSIGLATDSTHPVSVVSPHAVLYSLQYMLWSDRLYCTSHEKPNSWYLGLLKTLTHLAVWDTFMAPQSQRGTRSWHLNRSVGHVHGTSFAVWDTFMAPQS